METRGSDSILSAACMTPARALPILVAHHQTLKMLLKYQQKHHFLFLKPFQLFQSNLNHSSFQPNYYLMMVHLQLLRQLLCHHLLTHI